MEYILNKLSFWLTKYAYYKLFGKRNLKVFQKFIQNSVWRKETIDHSDVWICEDDETFQITSSERIDNFTEEWTKKYPDKLGSWKFNQELRINGQKVKESMWIALDGGRYYVPLPEVDNQSGTPYWYWNKPSLRWKIAKMFEKFYLKEDTYSPYKYIDFVAEKSEINIIEK